MRAGVVRFPLVSVASVEAAFNHIRSVDFGAYYRDTIYTNTELGIAKEYVSAGNL